MNAPLRSPVADPFLQRLSYAQCWEDASILQQALKVGPDDDVLSIASGGDNSFALAIAGARSVTAIDLSIPQLAVTELKLVATDLDHAEYLCLLGIGGPGDRRALYRRIEPALSERARSYWRHHLELIDQGLLASGTFERYLETFRTRVLPLVHGRETVDALCSLTNLEEQRQFHRQRWNTWRWRGLFRLFFSRAVMSRSGRTQAHFAHVTGSVSDQFLARADHVVRDIPIRSNPYVQWMLRGRFPDVEQAHLYLTRAGFEKLRQVRPNIRILMAQLEEHLPSVPAGAYSAFNYSDLFEYVSAEQHEALLGLTVKAARPGARIAYWNLLVPRHRPESLANTLERHEAEAAQWLQQDRAFVYGGFNLEVVK